MIKRSRLWFINLLVLLLVSCALLSPAAQETPTAEVEPTGTEPPAGPTNTVEITATFPDPTETATTAPTVTITPTEVAVIKADSFVRRLSASVFTGLEDTLSELRSNDSLALDAGGQVTTNAVGEAEVIIQDCLKLFIFQDSSLTRSTCRKDDFGGGLGACATGGLTGVLNNCSSLVDIQTPVSRITTDGTWFSVIYLPDEQLNIVQVYEGEVDVQAKVDPQVEQYTSAEQVEEGGMWFTSPGQDAPNIAGINGREEQPLEVWEALRPELIDRYPELDKWLVSAEDRADDEDLPFPGFLAPPEGEVTLHFAGSIWEDDDVREAVLDGVEWKRITKNNWRDFEIRPRIEIGGDELDDARIREYNPDEARRLLVGSNIYSPSSSTQVTIAVPDDDDGLNYFTDLYAQSLVEAFAEIGISAYYFTGPTDGIQESAKAADASDDFPFIWITIDGEAFEDS